MAAEPPRKKPRLSSHSYDETPSNRETQAIIISDDEDNELQAAIQLSLQQECEIPPTQHTNNFIKSEDIIVSPQVSTVKPPYYFNYLKGFSDRANKSTLSLKQIIPVTLYQRTCLPPKGGAQMYLLTSYEIDLEWLFSECPHLLCTPTIIAHGESNLVAENMPPTLKLLKPSLPISYGVHHRFFFFLTAVKCTQ